MREIYLWRRNGDNHLAINFIFTKAIFMLCISIFQILHRNYDTIHINFKNLGVILIEISSCMGVFRAL